MIGIGFWVSLFVLFFGGLMASCLGAEVQDQNFEATHPELTDEEFLKLFEWPVNPEVALKVRRILAEISCLPENRIRPQDELVKDLQLD